MITQAQLCESPTSEPVKEQQQHLKAGGLPKSQSWDDTNNPTDRSTVTSAMQSRGQPWFGQHIWEKTALRQF